MVVVPFTRAPMLGVWLAAEVDIDVVTLPGSQTGALVSGGLFSRLAAVPDVVAVAGPISLGSICSAADACCVGDGRSAVAEGCANGVGWLGV